jgi:lipopolysaccharide export system permease protein
MFTTFDRYLLGRMLHTFGVFLVATYGLYIVIDLFTNIDAFQMEAQRGADKATLSGGAAWSDQAVFWDMSKQIGMYYSFRLSEFLELAGPVLVTISAVAVLGLMEKHSESHPILAAGVPAFRLLKPFLIGAVALNFLLIANQELIMPNLAVQLQTPRGKDQATKQQVIPVYDYSNHMMSIDGESVSVAESRLDGAVFSLTSELIEGACTLRAESAVFLPANEKHPSGWLLTNQTGVFEPDKLTEEGRARIKPRPNGIDVFVVSDVNFDELYDQGRNPKLLSSLQLVKRIRSPATGSVSVRKQSLALHSRVTRPLLSLLTIAIVLPLVLRRESMGLIVNLAICGLVLAVSFGLTQGSLLMGSAGLIRPDVAAWFPVVLTGTTSVWTAGYVQT